ncbi:MAG: type II toxin-antitoxin system HicB family antitoxin [Candidatus Binatia bacterium]
MKCTVIIENKDGRYRALIPSLPGLSAEGTTVEEALTGAQREATAYLARVAVESIDIDLPTASQSSAQSWIDAAGIFKGDQEHLKHFADLAVIRGQQRESDT